MTQRLLQRGADPSLAGSGGRFPLHAAAEAGRFDTLRLLLNALQKAGHSGAVSARDDRGLTPLGLASQPACVRELAEAGAALSPADLSLLMRDRRDVLYHLFDLGVQADGDGHLRVTYRAFRDVGGDCPFETELFERWELLLHPAVELLLDVTRRDTFWLAVCILVFSLVFLTLLCVTVMFDLYQFAKEASYMLKWVLFAFTSCVC